MTDRHGITWHRAEEGRRNGDPYVVLVSDDDLLSEAVLGDCDW